jgi:hypothetical protein
MSAKNKFVGLVLWAVLVLFMWQGGADPAWSGCELKLPDPCPGADVQVTRLHANELEKCITILDPSNVSYFDTTIDMPENGFVIGDGTFPGWCLDLEGEVKQNDKFPANLYSTLDPPSYPAGEITRDISEEEWNGVNWILNNKVGTWLDVQAAIWKHLEGSYPPDFPFGEFENEGGCPGKGGAEPFTLHVDTMVTGAQSDEGKNFKPVPGDLVGIIVVPLYDGTCEPDPTKQLNMIEVEFPCTLEVTKEVSGTVECIDTGTDTDTDTGTDTDTNGDFDDPCLCPCEDGVTDTSTDADGDLFCVVNKVKFTYKVINKNPDPCALPLEDVMVLDDNGTPDDPSDDFMPTYISGDDNDDKVLDPGETWLFESDEVCRCGGVNTVTVTGVLPDGTLCKAMDTAELETDLTCIDDGTDTGTDGWKW